ncbi:MAG: cytochrome c [Anaeromyxobacteraceae bacterium]
MRRHNGWVVAVVTALVLVPFGARAERPRLTHDLVVDGKAAFAARCASCHGEEGRGDGPAAAALPVMPRDLRRDGYTRGRKAPEVFATLATGTEHAMPSFDALPERERWALTYRVLLLHAAGRSERTHAEPTAMLGVEGAAP